MNIKTNFKFLNFKYFKFSFSNAIYELTITLSTKQYQAIQTKLMNK